jgi:hypothetical protein
VKFVLQVEDGGSDVTQQYKKSNCLIFNYRHQKEGKTHDENQGRNADKKKVVQVGQKDKSCKGRGEIEDGHHTQGNGIQDDENPNVSKCFANDIIGIGDGSHVDHFGGIQFLVLLQKLGGQENCDDCLCKVDDVKVGKWDHGGKCDHIPIGKTNTGLGGKIVKEDEDQG